MLSKGRIKDLKSLHQKKYRNANGVYLVEGDKLVREAIKSSIECVIEVFAISTWDAFHSVSAAGIQVTEVSQKELDRICELKNPNQAAAVISFPKSSSPLTSLKENWTIYLHSLRDPGNLGTILRIMDWYGIGQLICSPDSVEPFNQKVIQASMGATFRVPIHYMKLNDIVELAEAERVPMMASVMNGTSIKGIEPGKEGLLFMGNEAKGLDEQLISKCNRRLRIPGSGNAESLNVAVATGILMQWVYSSLEQ